MAAAEGLCQPGPGAHLLPLDAVILGDHEEEPGGEVALRVAAAAEPVQEEREHEPRVLGHGQVLVQGLCQRRWAEGATGPRGQQASGLPRIRAEREG